MTYQNQLCPIALAMDILGEKWTLLIIRELLGGSTRFNDFQRGLRTLSPTLLSKRLNSLEQQGLLVRKHIPGQRGYEYFPTPACVELDAMLEQIGIWGMRWARSQMTEDAIDLELLMVYLERSIQPDQLIGRETVIRFNFTDAADLSHWWIVVSNGETEICVHDPGKEVDIYLNVGVQVMCQLWMGDISFKRAVADGKLSLVGQKNLVQSVEHWLKPNRYAGIEPASAILEPV